LNIDLYKEMPGCVFKDAQELVKKIGGTYDLKKLKKYQEKYIEVTNGKSTEKICQLIINNLKDR